MSDLDEFLALETKQDKYYLSYLRLNTECVFVINFQSLKITSIDGNNNYNSSKNVMFDGKIVRAILNDQLINNQEGKIILPAKSFKSALDIYSVDDASELGFIKITMKKITRRRYDIMKIEEVIEDDENN